MEGAQFRGRRIEDDVVLPAPSDHDLQLYDWDENKQVLSQKRDVSSLGQGRQASLKWSLCILGPE